MKNGFAWNTHQANRKKKNFTQKFLILTPSKKKNKFTHEKLFHARLKEKLFFYVLPRSLKKIKKEESLQNFYNFYHEIEISKKAKYMLKTNMKIEANPITILPLKDAANISKSCKLRHES